MTCMKTFATLAVSFLALLRLAAAFGSNGKGSGCVFASLGANRQSRRLHTAGERRLLQESCGPIQLGSDSVSLASCSDLTSNLGTDYKFQWTVVDSGDGNSTLRGAIDVAATAGSVDWAGLGFQQELEMIGGNAIIVKTCSTCPSGASVDDYYLANTNAASVRPPSQLRVTSKSAALTNGRLHAVFEVSLALSGNALSSAGVIYAAGPLDTAGGLEQHTYYTGSQIDLSRGLASSLGPALAPLASSPSNGAVAPAPARSTAGGLASAPAPGGGCSMEFAGNRSRLTFSQCTSLATAGTANAGFRLLWNIRENPSGNGSIMTGAIESGNPQSWAGYGFPANPGVMLGTNAIIVKPCASCPTGASADNYLLSAYETSGVVAGTGALKIGDLAAARSSSGSIQAVFTMFLTQSTSELSNPINILASVGPVGSNEQLQAHPVSYAYSGTVNLGTGSLSGQQSSSAPSRKAKVHAILMIVGWGLLLPLGTVFGRCKEWGRVWFQLHRACQALGYLAGTAGAATAAAMGRVHRTKLEDNHRIVGLTVFILLTIQVSAIFYRPAPRASALRYTWNSLHWILGGSAIFIAFSNVFIGLHISGQPARWSGLYALGFGLILLLWLGKLAFNLTILKSRRRQQGGKGYAASSSSDALASNGQYNGQGDGKGAMPSNKV